MSFRSAARWVGWVALGAFLGPFLVCLTAFLWCLPYMTSESYCTGDAPFVGYMLVVSAPFSIMTGALIAIKLLQRHSLKEALRREAESYLKRDKPDLRDPDQCLAFIQEQFESLPQRRKHILAVAERVRNSAQKIQARHPQLGVDETKAWCAALLHDVGYLKAVAETGFHPVDGYKFLTKYGFADLAELIVGHSSSPEEAELHGIDWVKPSADIHAELITYWDLQVLPNGELTTVEQRLADILSRYGPDSLIGRATEKARPRLLELVARIAALHEATSRAPNLPG